MKTFLMILLLSIKIFATPYYVNLSGTGGGTSWATAKAYTSFSFSSLVAGDIVYVDGGADSVTYGLWTINKSVSGGIITITRGLETGHNGKPIFRLASDGGDHTSFELTSCVNIKLSHLSIKWNLGETSSTQYNRCVLYNGGHDCIIDSCEVISDGGANGVYIGGGAYNIQITNNWVQVYPNSIADKDQCDINIYSAGGGHVISGNTLIQGGSSASSAVSCENIYIGYDGYNGNALTSKPQLLIANNFMLYDNILAGGNGGSVTAIYMYQSYSCRLVVYNNIIMQHTMNIDGFEIVGQNVSGGIKVSLKMYNNTFYSNSTACNVMRISTFDTLEIKNNIFRAQHGYSNLIAFTYASLASITSKVIDYNQYYDNGTTFTIGDYPSGTYSWSTWQGMGYDTHSLRSAASFVNVNGDNAADYKISAGAPNIDNGVTISTVTTDYFNTARPQGGTYDIGAYEYISSPVIPTVTTTTATSIGTVSASSGGNVTSSGGVTVTSRGVCWNTSANPTTSNSHTSDGSGTGVFTSSISGLNNNTLYHYRSYAVNSAGTAYGNDLTFTTLGVVTAPTLIAPINETINSTITITFSWSTVIGATSYNYLIERYYNGVWSTAFSGNTASTSVTKTMPVIGTYRWSVQTVSGGSTGVFSSTFLVTTVVCQ